MLEILWKSLFTGFLAAFGVLLVQLLVQTLRRNFRRGLPPGPYGLPFFGYLPFMSKDGHLGVEDLKKKYGNVFGVNLGCRYVVFLCDFDVIKEALSKDCLLDRPNEFPFKVNKKSQGLIVCNGPLWKESRRLSLKLFKNLGMASETMERHIHDELSHLIREFHSTDGQPVSATHLLTPSTSNIISALVFGRRFEYMDPERIYLDKLIEIIPALAAQISSINFFPWLRDLMVFFKVGACEKLRDALVRREMFAESKIDYHEKTYQSNVVRDYIDGFFTEMKRQEDSSRTLTRNLLRGNVASFFGAGSETVRAAVDWLVLTAAIYPEMQRRIQTEIAEMVGRDREVAWADRSKLPYTQAFVWEMMRFKPVNPVSLMRLAKRDVKVGDYVIPKGSIVISSIWSVFHDAKFWGDPEVFRPERFLVDGGTRAEKPERFIPFSYGKRACPGELIANMEVFIYFTTILQNFNISPAPSGPPLCFDGVLGISLRPKMQNLVFSPR